MILVLPLARLIFDVCCFFNTMYCFVFGFLLWVVFMKIITIKRPSFLSKDYYVSINGTLAYTSTVKFTLKDPQEIVLNPTGNQPTITMKPVGGKTGYGERAEYALHKGGTEEFGFLVIEGRVNPTIRLLDAKRTELGVITEKSKIYSIIRTFSKKILPNYYTCKNNARVVFKASEVYTPILCRVKIQLDPSTPSEMDDFAICSGLWIACTPSW